MEKMYSIKLEGTLKISSPFKRILLESCVVFCLSKSAKANIK